MRCVPRSSANRESKAHDEELEEVKWERRVKE